MRRPTVTVEGVDDEQWADDDRHPVIPLFPLNHVLMPGMPLPLHIFEQRYRDLVDDLEEAGAGRAFGVVCLRSGTEARPAGTPDDGPDLETVGTLAEIMELERSPDGTSDLLCVGSRRFTVLDLVPGAPYVRARVEFLPDLDGDLHGGQNTRARELFAVYDAALARLAGRPVTEDDLGSDPGQLSFQLAARLPLGPGDRQALLAVPDAATRLARLAELTRRELTLLERTRSIAVSPSVLRISAGLN